jgi:hypothetical protein
MTFLYTSNALDSQNNSIKADSLSATVKQQENSSDKTTGSYGWHSGQLGSSDVSQTDEKNIVLPCSYCAYATTRAVSLRRHLAAKHKAEPTPPGYPLADSNQPDWWPGTRLEPQVEITVGSSCSQMQQGAVRPARTGLAANRCGGSSRAGQLQKLGMQKAAKVLSKKLKPSMDWIKPGQVTLEVTRTKVIVQRRELSSEEYSFRCLMCPFATNQAMFLSKHVSRHHKSNKLCN